MNKRLLRCITVCMTAVFLLSFTGCSEKVRNSTEGFHIVTTNFALYDFASAVCGDTDTVTMLLPPGAESHDYEVTLADMAVLESCDLLIYIGGESEDWVYEALATLEEYGSAPKTLSALAVLDNAGALYPEETVGSTDMASTAHGEEHTHDTLDADTYIGMDEHVWTSIPNALTLINAIADTIRQIDENHVLADYAPYTANLAVLHEKLHVLTESTENPQILIADRFPFLYMVKEYGIVYYAAFAGCASDTEPSVAVVDTLIRQVEENEMDTLFVIEFSDRRTAEMIAAETGAKIAELHSCHNVSAADFTAGVTYLELMERNYNALAAAWNQEIMKENTP